MRLPSAYNYTKNNSANLLFIRYKEGGDSTLVLNAVTWGRGKGGVQTDISGTVGGDCIVSEDVIVVGEDRMIVNGNCLVDEGRIVHSR